MILQGVFTEARRTEAAFDIILIDMLLLIILFAIYILGEKPPRPCELSVRLGDPNTISYSKEVRAMPKHMPALIDRKPARRIPFRMLQTNEKVQLPIGMIETVMYMLDLNPEYEYVYFDAEDRREFLCEKMGERILNAYDKLIPSAYKADLFRYCYIYTYGGCYLDAGSYAVAKLTDIIGEDDEFVSTFDMNGYGLNSAFFCSIPSHKILEFTIHSAVEAI